MQKVDLAGAWADFKENVLPGVRGRRQRQDILRAVSHERLGLLGDERRRRILKQYGGARYEFSEFIFIRP